MEDFVIVRGGGDLATGIIQKLHRSGFQVLVLEIDMPSCIRRNVALCEAVYEGFVKVEDMDCRLVENYESVQKCWDQGEIPLMIDRDGTSIQELKPNAVVDAIIAKRNMGTKRWMAPITIGVGPGFTAGEEVDIVIETLRGHDLGRMILEGTAAPNTGIPGEIRGKSSERVIHAGRDGVITHKRAIGDRVSKGEVLFYIDGFEVRAPFDGLLRGLIREGYYVQKGLKVGDIDPRTDIAWNSISDKARAIGGAVLEAYLYLKKVKLKKVKLK